MSGEAISLFAKRLCKGKRLMRYVRNDTQGKYIVSNNEDNIKTKVK
jgi:hypothetical protein